MSKISLKDLDVKGKKVLMRVDFNVPLSDGKITDDTRLRESLPSIQYILKNGGSVILMSHLGRPKGKKDPQFSLKPCSDALAKLLNHPVQFATDCIGPEVEKKAQQLKPGDVLLLENLRFYSAEEEPEEDPSFAEKLSHLGDVYVNDAFGTAHRTHSSTATIAKYFPAKAAVGFLMQKEIYVLTSILQHPKRPFFAIIGGAKISSKMGVLKALLSKVDKLFVGGGMAYTFFKAEGIAIGNSLCEEELVSSVKPLLDKVILPVDVVIANAFSNDAQHKTIAASAGIPDGWQGVDIGPKTARMWGEAFQKAATIFWNGPVGVFEMPNFAKGTAEIAKSLAASHAKRIVGGGDSVAAIQKLKLADGFTHLSTGGGASLEFIEYGRLPGIDALSDI